MLDEQLTGSFLPVEKLYSYPKRVPLEGLKSLSVLRVSLLAHPLQNDCLKGKRMPCLAAMTRNTHMELVALVVAAHVAGLACVLLIFPLFSNWLVRRGIGGLSRMGISTDVAAVRGLPELRVIRENHPC